MRRLLMLSATALVAGCATGVSDRPCPRVTEFPPEVQQRAAEELAGLPGRSFVPQSGPITPPGTSLALANGTVPEPGTLPLLGIGIAAALYIARRGKN